MIVPGEYIVAADGAMVTVLVALGIALSHTRERLSRLEGAAAERDHNTKENDG